MELVEVLKAELDFLLGRYDNIDFKEVIKKYEQQVFYKSKAVVKGLFWF
jgi:hypothetical protein